MSDETVILPTASFITVGETGVVRGINNAGFATVITGADVAPGISAFGGGNRSNAGEVSNAVGSGVVTRGASSRVVSAGTIISGEYAGLIFTDALGTLVKTGTITARYGQAMSVARNSCIENDRLISNAIVGGGSEPVIRITGTGVSLRNTGTIEAFVTAIEGGTTGALETGHGITNLGLISGAVVLGGPADDTIVTRGTINSAVSFGSGNDLFDGTAGVAMNGTVQGGTGDDA